MKVPRVRALPSAVQRDANASSAADAADELTGVRLNVSTCSAAHTLDVSYTRHTVHTDTCGVLCTGGVPGQRLSGSASLQLGRLSLESCGSSDFAHVRESSCSAAVELPRALARVALSEAAGELETQLELQTHERSGRRYVASACFSSSEPSRVQLRRTVQAAMLQRTVHERLAVDATGAVQLRWEELRGRAAQGAGKETAVERCVDVRHGGAGASTLAGACTLALPRSAKLRCAICLSSQVLPEASVKLMTPQLVVALKQHFWHAAPSVLLKLQRPSEDAKPAQWTPQCTLSWDAADGPTLALEASDGPSGQRSARVTLEVMRTRAYAAWAFGTLVC